MLIFNKNNLVLFVPVLLAFAITVFGTLTQGFSGVDILFHLKIAEAYSVGDISGAINVAFGENHTFYPPLFHLLLAVGYWLGCPTNWAYFLQIVLLPCVVGCFMFLVYKIQGKTASLYGGLLLLGSMAFLDRVIQAQPQALDFLFLSLMFYCFLFGFKRGFLFSSVLMVWCHGLVSIASQGGVLIGWLKRRNWRVLAGWLLGVFFVLGVSFYFLFGGLQNYGGRVDTDQEYLFWHSWSFGFKYLGLLSLGFVVLAYYVYRFLRHQPVSNVAKLSVITVLCVAVMVPMWADRWLQYCSIPLALLLLDAVHFLGWRLQLLFKVAVMLMVIFTIGGLFLF